MPIVTKVDWTNQKVDLKIEADLSLGMSNSIMPEFETLLTNLYLKIPLKKVTVDRKGNTLEYSYGWEAKDGRTWSQTIVFATTDDSDPTMTFDVPEGVKKSEYQHGRDLRDLIIRMIVEFKVKKLSVEWKA